MNYRNVLTDDPDERKSDKAEIKELVVDRVFRCPDLEYDRVVHAAPLIGPGTAAGYRSAGPGRGLAL